MISAHEVGFARPADARQIAEMSRDSIEVGLGWKWTATRILRCIRDESTNVVAVRESSDLTGFAIMTYKVEEAHLLLFAVAPNHRRQGVGSALLSWLDETALIAGIGLIHLEVRTRNREARVFYRKNGYREIAHVREVA